MGWWNALLTVREHKIDPLGGTIVPPVSRILCVGGAPCKVLFALQGSLLLHVTRAVVP